MSSSDRGDRRVAQRSDPRVVKHLPPRAALEFLERIGATPDPERYLQLRRVARHLSADDLVAIWDDAPGDWSRFVWSSSCLIGERHGRTARQALDNELDPTRGVLLDLRVRVLSGRIEELTGQRPPSQLRNVLRRRRIPLADLEALLDEAARMRGSWKAGIWDLWRVSLKVRAEFDSYGLGHTLPYDWVRGVARLLDRGIDEKVLVNKAAVVGRKNANVFRTSAYNPYAYWYRCCEQEARRS